MPDPILSGRLAGVDGATQRTCFRHAAPTFLFKPKNENLFQRVPVTDDAIELSDS